MFSLSPNAFTHTYIHIRLQTHLQKHTPLANICEFSVIVLYFQAVMLRIRLRLSHIHPDTHGNIQNAVTYVSEYVWNRSLSHTENHFNAY